MVDLADCGAEVSYLPGLPEGMVAGVAILENCLLWGYNGGCVIDRSGRIVRELSPDVWPGNEHTALTVPTLPRRVELLSSHAVVGAPFADGNYYHWVADAFSRMHLLDALTSAWRAEVDSVLVPSSASYVKAFLELGGVTAPTRVMNRKAVFAVERLIVPFLLKPAFEPPPWLPAMLRRLVEPDSGRTPGNRRLWVSRGRASFRRIRNEDDLLSVLSAHGFEVVNLEDLSVKEQLRLLSDSSVVAGPHGAGFVNCAVCAPGSSLLEVFAARYRPGYMERIAAVAGLVYHTITTSEILEDRHRPDGLQDDIVLDPGQLSAALEKILGASPS